MKLKSILFSFALSLILPLATLGAPDPGSPGVSDGPEEPNVLFLSVDDMNNWIDVLEGHPEMDIHTPNLDRLAQSSVVFTNAHAPSPACAPSRTAIMTGVHPSRSGIMDNIGGDGPVWRQHEPLGAVRTLEEFFKNRGYTTLGGGKIYHAQAPPWTTDSQVEAENWDFYYPSPYITHPHQIRAPEEVIRPDHFTDRDWGSWWTWGPIPIKEEKMADYHIAEWVAHELRREREKPFFLAAGTWKPHDPWEVPQKYFDMYPMDEVTLPEYKVDDLEDTFFHGRRFIHEWVLENDQRDNIVQAYAAAITFADAMIGKMLDALESSPHADDTIVVLWSDHGMHMGEKENWEKFTLWESSTHAPLMMKVPGLTDGGLQRDQPVSLLDIYPTLADLLGDEVPDHVDGQSLVPLFDDPEAERGPVVSSYNFSWIEDPEVGHSVRSERYRYIYYPETGLQELYDHRTDPAEWTNIAYRDENRDVVERHRQYLRERIPTLTWDNVSPEGFEIGEDGTVRKVGFTPTEKQP